VYELRGVLLHKGASAYHGHYEAQVLDTAWVARWALAREVLKMIQIQHVVPVWRWKCHEDW
jgi:hypothetical protein